MAPRKSRNLYPMNYSGYRSPPIHGVPIGGGHSGGSRVLRGTSIGNLLISIVLLGLAAGYALAFGDHGNLLPLLQQITGAQFAVVVSAIALSVLLGAARLKALAGEFGHSLRFSTSVQVVAASQAAANFFFQIYGQIVSRGLLLKRHGVPYSTTVLVTLLERLVGLAVLLTLATLGALMVFGQITIRLDKGGAELVRTLAGLAVASAAVLWALKRSGHLGRGVELLGGIVKARAIVLTTLYTLAIQAATLVSFTVAALALAPDIGLLNLVAASTVVMLASALPISFGGWGVRELSAVIVLGAVGVSPEAALAAAVLIGVLSLGVVIALGSLAWLPHAEARAPRAGILEYKPEALSTATLLGWTIPLLVAALLFFQIHVPVGQGAVNVCLADPLIVVGAGLFLLQLKRGETSWKVEHLGLYAASCFIVILLGYVHGWIVFGSNPWAATKLFGWLVLAAYAMCGALIVRVAGDRGRDAACWALIGALIGIAVLEYARYAAAEAGLKLLVPYSPRIAGFAQDANAFAFQVVAVIAVILVVCREGAGKLALLAGCFTALWLSGSRSAALAGAVMLALALYLRPRRAKIVALAVLAAATLVVLPLLIPDLPGARPALTSTIMLQPRPLAINEHWMTIETAWGLFLSSPLIGSGLGYFVEHFPRADGSSLIVHSSYLWVLAELGLVGFAVLGASALGLWRSVWRRVASDDGCQLALLLLTALATMSLVQDMLFQRVTYFILGLALALASTRTPHFEVSSGATGP